MSTWGAALTLTALAVLVMFGVTYVAARRTGTASVVDVVWGLFFVAIGWAAVLAGGTRRSLLLAVLVTLWGVRLAVHIGTRNAGKGEDPRYVELLAKGGGTLSYAVKRAFLPQAVIAWFVGLPLTVAATTNRPLGWVAWLGVAVFAVGLAFEAIGDAQLRAFKADPANRGKIMDRGLWAWTRHPNYFGDATVWWGLWLVAAEAWPGVLTVLSPLAMTYFLAFRTGATLLEKDMAKRPGYAAYMERTSRFLPRPPRKLTQ